MDVHRWIEVLAPVMALLNENQTIAMVAIPAVASIVCAIVKVGGQITIAIVKGVFNLLRNRNQKIFSKRRRAKSLPHFLRAMAKTTQAAVAFINERLRPIHRRKEKSDSKPRRAKSLSR